MDPLWIMLGGGPTSVEVSRQPRYSAGATAITVIYAGRRPVRRLRVLLLGSRRSRRGGGGILHHEVIGAQAPAIPAGEFTCALAELPRGTAANHRVVAVEIKRDGTPAYALEYPLEPALPQLSS